MHTRIFSHTQFVACFALLLSSCLLSGCGEPAAPTGTLSGTVTVAGKPYAKPSQLAIISMQTGRAYATPITEGKYDFGEPILTGEYTAYLTPAPAAGDSEQPMSVTIDTSIEDQYWNEATSPLKVTVAEGANTESLEIP